MRTPRVFCVELVLRCACGQEALRTRIAGDEVRVTRWARSWEAVARRGLTRQHCPCGAELVLEHDGQADVEVTDLRGAPVRDKHGKSVRVHHGCRLVVAKDRIAPGREK